MTETKNAFKVKPATASHVLLKERGVRVDTIIGSKLLKIKVKDFIDEGKEITNENLRAASVLCLCSCSNFCVFPVEDLIDPDVLPACSECDAQLDEYLSEQASLGRMLTRKQAWEEQGVFCDESQYSRVFLDFADRSNSQALLNPIHNILLNQSDMHRYGLERRNLLSVIRGLNTVLTTLDKPIFNYQCLCRRIAVFGLDVLNTPEPLGMCSTCAHELRYSLRLPDLNAQTQKLEFKYQWKLFLETNKYPMVSFKYVWEQYLNERRELRKQYIELHFKHFLEKYDFSNVEEEI